MKPVLAVVVPIVLVLPWAEELWIAWNFAKLCEGAGVHVTRKVEVAGFYDATMRTGYELIDRYGYQFMEHPSRGDGKIEHIEKTGNDWKVTKLDQPEARFHYRFSDPRQEVLIKWKIEKIEKQILDSKTDEIIATDTRFNRWPNTIEWQWVRFFGLGLTFCYGPVDEPEKQIRTGLLHNYVFVPKK